jgi:hypothetical protein
MGVAAAISLSGAFALGATGPAQAAPLSVNALALKEAAPENVVDVRRRRHYGGHAVAGLALGIIGAVIAHQAYKDSRRYHRHHYYQPHGYYYGPPSCIRKYGAVYCR